VYNGGRRGWAGELGIPGEDQQPVFLDDCAIRDELIALGYDVRIALGRRALLQNGSGTAE